MRRGALTPHTRVHTPEPRVEQVVELGERQVGDAQPAHLWNDDEPFARHLQRVRQFDVAGENEHQLVAGAEFVLGVHRAIEVGQKLAGGAAEEVEAKDAFALRRLTS